MAYTLPSLVVSEIVALVCLQLAFALHLQDLLGAGVLLSAIAAAAALWSYGKRPVTALQGVVATSPSQPVVAMFATTRFPCALVVSLATITTTIVKEQCNGM